MFKNLVLSIVASLLLASICNYKVSAQSQDQPKVCTETGYDHYLECLSEKDQ